MEVNHKNNGVNYYEFDCPKDVKAKAYGIALLNPKTGKYAKVKGEFLDSIDLVINKCDTP